MKVVQRGLVLAGLAFGLFLSSCATVGKKFPEQKVTKITVGETTKKEVQEMQRSPFTARRRFRRCLVIPGERVWKMERLLGVTGIINFGYSKIRKIMWLMI